MASDRQDKPNRNRSPRALPLPEPEPAIEVIPRDQRDSVFAHHDQPRVILQYANAKRYAPR